MKRNSAQCFVMVGSERETAFQLFGISERDTMESFTSQCHTVSECQLGAILDGEMEAVLVESGCVLEALLQHWRITARMEIISKREGGIRSLANECLKQ